MTRIRLRPYRVKITYVPKFEGPIQGHAINLIRRAYPSLAAYHEFEDLLQDAYIVFLKCKKRFHKGLGPNAFMALFSVSMNNKLHARYEQLSRYNFIEVMEDVPEVASPDLFDTCRVSEIPADLQDVLRVLACCNDDTYDRTLRLATKLVRKYTRERALPREPIKLRRYLSWQ